MAKCNVRYTNTLEPPEVFPIENYRQTVGPDTFYRATNGQLTWREGNSEFDGDIRVNTPGTQGVAGFFKAGQVIDLPDVKITFLDRDQFAAVYATAQDPTQTLYTADKVLILAVARARNTGMVLTLALSYGGRDELVDACRALAAAAAAGTLAPAAIDAAAVQAHLYAPHAPDVDLVIRTAGEQRLSNFLPWQTTYAEYVGVDACWPDVTAAVYHDALRAFQARERRFGAVQR